MSLTLDATLQAAQDGQEHHFIAEVKTKPVVQDIPFIGEYLTAETLQEERPNIFQHSGGRLCIIYNYDTQYFVYVYTDEERQEFNFVYLNVEDDLGRNLGDSIVEATICEIDSTTVGMIIVTENAAAQKYYLDWVKLSILGVVLDSGNIAEYAYNSYDQFVSPFVIQLADSSYMLAYISGAQVEITTSGTYTGSSDSEFEVEIVTAGDQTTAFFKWRIDDGAWSGAIQCTGAPQLLQDGVSITFVVAEYFVGQSFKFSVTAATYAKGYVSISENPDPDEQVDIDGTVYTYKTPPLVAGGNAYDVAIDIDYYEITLQNLQSAITDTSYQGTGEGVRYGTGTAAHPSVTATRSAYTLTLTALTAGAAGNNITISVPAGSHIASAMAGGKDSVIASVRTKLTSGLYKRTSADFETWSGATEIVIGNIVGKEKNHVSLKQLANGNIWVLFDYWTTWNYQNCYYSVSTDSGVTWGNAEALTDYDSALASGVHPMLVQKAANTLWFVYHETMGALHIDVNSPRWPGGISSISGLHIYNNKIYAIVTNTGLGTKYFIAVVEIDITSWEITDYWTESTSPAFHYLFTENHMIPNACRSAGKYCVVAVAETFIDYPTVAVLDLESDTIRHFYFRDWSEYGVFKNVDWVGFDKTYPNKYRLIHAAIDDVNANLYVVLVNLVVASLTVEIIEIDLGQADVPGSSYVTTRVYLNYHDEFVNGELVGAGNGDFRLFPNDGIALLSFAQTTDIYPGCLCVFDTATGWVLDKFNHTEATSLPYLGFKRCVYFEGRVYGTFDYYVGKGQSNLKGLARFDPGSEECVYFEPVWDFQVDDYGLLDIFITDDNDFIISSDTYGITVFNPGTANWEHFSNESVLGFTPDGMDTGFMPVVYDSNSGMIITGRVQDLQYWEGVVGFSRYGSLKQGKYKIGTYTDQWNFATEENLVLGYLDYEVAVALDISDNGLYAFWTRLDETEKSIKWAKETAQFDLTPYIIRSVPIVIKRSIENKPSTISFSLSRGHLFDPFNDVSLYRAFIKKGYEIQVRYGEVVNGIEYWQNMGTFIITERSTVTYERGKYPVMEIRGEDKRMVWEEMTVVVGEDYTGGDGETPENILDDLLRDVVGELLEDLDIPEFDNQTRLYHQWIDTTVMEIISQICDRYGYFSKITVDDDFTCKKISDSNDTDHTYSNTAKLISYTPDDTFSDYTNKIVVTCEGLDYSDSEKPAEKIATVTGTLGWWGEPETRTVYFSEDKKKKATPILATNLNLSLETIYSARANMMFRLAGGVKEEISEWATDFTYCKLKLEAPDLRLVLASLITAYVAACQTDTWASRVLQAGIFSAIMYIIGSITQFMYYINGHPIGDEKTSWQAIAHDLELQSELGRIVERTIEEPLAYYINECQAVADHEMFVLKSQRKRIKIKKTGHIQDEEGDTIQFVHPYSGRNIKMFVTNLTRSLKLPVKPGEKSGGLFDDLEGWIIG